jgi:hypothetical protein
LLASENKNDDFLMFSLSNILRSEKLTTVSIRTNAFYRAVHINCLANVEVFDDNGKRVAIMTDSELEVKILACSDGEEKILYLPPDMGYTVKITATEDGLMTYMLLEKKTGVSKLLRAVLYCQVEIKKGEAYTGSVPALSEQDYENTENGTKISYTLSEPSGQPFAPTSDGSVDDVILDFEVSINDESLGEVKDPPLAYRGQHVVAEVCVNNDALFDGWYENGAKIEGADSSYPFVIERSRKLVAQVTKK